MQAFKILFVDDEEINLLFFRRIFEDKYDIITAASGEEGLHCFQRTSDIGLVISDQRMPGISGIDMLSAMYDIDPDPIRILLTAHSQVDEIMDAINLGRIYQYILKPWDADDLERVIKRAREHYQLKKENISLTAELAEKNKNLELINEKVLLTNKELAKDVQERKALQESLKESEERFRKFTQASQDIIVLFDISGKELFINPAVETLLGYTVEEFRNKALARVLHPDDRRIVRKEIEELLATNTPSQSREVKIQKKDKKYLDMEMNLLCINLSSGEKIIGSIIRDISRRRIAEEQVRLSEERLGDLSAMLITAQDDERRRIAMELHDEFGQSLAALKMQLRALENKMHGYDESQKDDLMDELRELRQYVNMQIESVRSLSRELWPIMVDHLGIDSAIENLLTNFFEHADIEVDTNLEPIGSLLSVEEQRHLYRILQEAINNVIKHAEATNIQISTRLVGGDIVLAVHDNGCGFNVGATSKSTGKARGIGLQSMDERMKFLNGVMVISSNPSMGTSIIFTLPQSHKEE